MRIYTTPKSYIADVTLVTDISGTDGLVSYKVDTAGSGCGEVQVEILDMEGGRVALAQGSAGKVTIPEAKLWWPWPGVPYLYQAVVRYGEDRYGQTFGIRTVKVEGTKIFDQRKAFFILKGPNKMRPLRRLLLGQSVFFLAKGNTLHQKYHILCKRTHHLQTFHILTSFTGRSAVNSFQY